VIIIKADDLTERIIKRIIEKFKKGKLQKQKPKGKLK
jgi:hypothetical protein